MTSRGHVIRHSFWWTASNVINPSLKESSLMHWWFRTFNIVKVVRFCHNPIKNVPFTLPDVRYCHLYQFHHVYFLWSTNEVYILLLMSFIHWNPCFIQNLYKIRILFFKSSMIHNNLSKINHTHYISSIYFRNMLSLSL